MRKVANRRNSKLSHSEWSASARRHKNTQNTALESQQMENASSNYSAHIENTKAIQP